VSDQLLDALNKCHVILKSLDRADRYSLLELLARNYLSDPNQRARLLALLEASDTARDAWQR
jgi:hypothetical protein